MRQHSIHSKGPKQPARTPAHPVAPITFTHATAAENPQLETWGRAAFTLSHFPPCPCSRAHSEKVLRTLVPILEETLRLEPRRREGGRPTDRRAPRSRRQKHQPPARPPAVPLSA
jgi:hypothetical protein